MNDTNKTTLAQFYSLAPPRLAFRGEVYERNNYSVDDEADTISVDYTCVDYTGGLQKNRITFNIRYDEGPDLYSARAVFVDGKNVDSPEPVFEATEIFFDSFADVQGWLR